MGNNGLLSGYENSIGKYVNEHPNSMSIIIGKAGSSIYEVLFANTSAITYFLSEIQKPATQFFGRFWSEIKREIRYLKTDSIHTVNIEIMNQGNQELFELFLQQSSDKDGRELIFVELRDRKDVIDERQLKTELQHKYVSVIDHNLDPIFSINEEWQIIHANPAVHTTFGYRKHELSGCSILNFVQEKDFNRLEAFITRGFSGESIEMDEISFFHKLGNYLPTHLKALPVVVEDEITEIHLIVRDISEHHKNNEKLLYLSYHDQLTGLWNRRALKENFIEDCVTAIKEKAKLSIIHLGLDRFKLINDSLGHSGADEILKRVAERLKCISERTGRLYRHGGDEFIITFQNDSVEKTEEIARKLLEEFGKPFYYDHQEYFISASIGISVFPEDGKTAEELMQKAAQALFYVKEHGRSHYRFYEKVMNNLFLDEVLMESHLRRAIELDELKVYYQPQVDLRTGYISSFEALLRWNNKKFGFVSPGQFIPIAEESGLIHSIGDWVLDQVCEQIKEWQDKRYRKVRIAVNISPKQFRMENFSRKVKEKIDTHGIIASSLEVEITENALANINETLKTLNELKRIGIFVSVDDFGTGYSSLSYLKQYPIDIIKIDRSFIHDIELDDKNKAIAKTIINLAHNLGMEVIAEGVEKDLQAQILLDAKCQKAQGFLYSRAVPVEEIIDKYFAVSL